MRHEIHTSLRTALYRATAAMLGFSLAFPLAAIARGVAPDLAYGPPESLHLQQQYEARCMALVREVNRYPFSSREPGSLASQKYDGQCKAAARIAVRLAQEGMASERAFGPNSPSPVPRLQW